jgi:hypothetical protein
MHHSAAQLKPLGLARNVQGSRGEQANRPWLLLLLLLAMLLLWVLALLLLWVLALLLPLGPVLLLLVVVVVVCVMVVMSMLLLLLQGLLGVLLLCQVLLMQPRQHLACLLLAHCVHELVGCLPHCCELLLGHDCVAAMQGHRREPAAACMQAPTHAGTHAHQS